MDFVYWWRRWEFAILASQCACRHIGVHGLAAALLEFPTYPAPVPDAVSFPDAQIKIKKPTKNGELFYFVGGGGGN